VSTDLSLSIEFQITDSAGLSPLSDKTAVVELDLASLLRVVQGKEEFVLQPKGMPFFQNIRIAYPGPLTSPLEQGICLILALLAASLVWFFFLREDRFFYEAKGLDTIIFLFENNEVFSAHHSRHVAELTEILGRSLGIRGKRLKDLRTAALLHDIGKIAIPWEILTKPGALSEEETVVMRTHAESSARILRYFNELAHLAPVVQSHHEMMDGSGYPQGLTGEHIPLGSRIIAVADIYEALTGKRPYRSPFTPEKALEVLMTLPLDPQITKTLVTYIRSHEGQPVFDRLGDSSSLDDLEIG
jgi:putative nucleotidyltransferase with HDIG domain